MVLHFFKRIRCVLQKFSRLMTEKAIAQTEEPDSMGVYTGALKYASIYLSRIRKNLAEKSGE